NAAALRSLHQHRPPQGAVDACGGGHASRQVLARLLILLRDSAHPGTSPQLKQLTTESQRTQRRKRTNKAEKLFFLFFVFSVFSVTLWLVLLIPQPRTRMSARAPPRTSSSSHLNSATRRWKRLSTFASSRMRLKNSTRRPMVECCHDCKMPGRSRLMPLTRATFSSARMKVLMPVGHSSEPLPTGP